MAWLEQEKSGIYHICFRFQGERIKKSAGTRDERKAEIKRARIEENLELVGEAKWVREAGDRAGYWVGLELQDSSREDMEKWFRVVKRLQKNAALAAGTHESLELSLIHISEPTRPY